MKGNLKSIRQDVGYLQFELAAAIGISKQTLNKWEMGRAPVAKKHWSRLASLLHLSETELESALVETLLDACIAKQNARPLLNAQTSRLYNSELVADALSRFTSTPSVYFNREEWYPANPSASGVHPISEREMKLDYERKIFERDKKIFELEKEVSDLRRQLESNRPAAYLSSILDGNHTKLEVKP